jgi:predicted hydrolase (HD superfamily)
MLYAKRDSLYGQPMTLILELPDNKEAALRAKAQAQGVSAEQYAAQVLSRDLDETVSSTGTDEWPIWEIIAKRMKDVPDEVFDQLPKDGASQIDHYIYGLPKRD